MIPFFKRKRESSESARHHLADMKVRLEGFQHRSSSHAVALGELFAKMGEDYKWPSNEVSNDGLSLADLVVKDLAAKKHEPTASNGKERAA